MSDSLCPIVAPVILSGGAGTRLWPLSRRARPKQMLDLTGGGSMLALTAAGSRTRRCSRRRWWSRRREQAEAIEAALPGLGALILEPAARNTAPAIALAALAAPARRSAAGAAERPSDRAMPRAFARRCGGRRRSRREGWIVTFGMKAERAETGYGYVAARSRARRRGVRGRALRREARCGHRRGLCRPTDGTTGTAASSCCAASAMLDALARHAPDILRAAEAAMAGATRDGVARPSRRGGLPPPRRPSRSTMR